MSEQSQQRHTGVGRRRWAVAEGYIPQWSHVRFNALRDPEPVPHRTEYSSVIESDVPIVVQHTRLDSRQAENALMTTIAFPAD
ncbi:MAG TPA: sensory rhodopsin transducer [Steroidobacteraceae bacterium]|nr:sensory rhodopsin transducer [Steroidobacteraceae bacterium]